MSYEQLKSTNTQKAPSNIFHATYPQTSMNTRRQDHRHLRRHKASKGELKDLLEGANAVTDSLTARLLITTMVAAFRGGNLSLKSAADACSMSEDDFRRAGTIVDDEANRMLANKDKLDGK